MQESLLTLSKLLIGLFAAALVERVGRRPLFLTATTGNRHPVNTIAKLNRS
jgi:hypothetical protein